MTVPYQPEPGCSAVQAQQARQIHNLRQQLKAAEDELGPLRQRVDVLNRGAEVREALLAEARDLLEPWGGHGDDWPSLVPPIEALIGKLDEALQRAEQAEARTISLQAECDGAMEGWRNESGIYSARIAAARALHTIEICNEYGALECGLCREVWPCPTATALDGLAVTRP